MEKSKLNSEKIQKIQKKSVLNYEKIAKLWKKGKLNIEKIWNIWRKIIRIVIRYGQYGRKVS